MVSQSVLPKVKKAKAIQDKNVVLIKDDKERLAGFKEIEQTMKKLDRGGFKTYAYDTSKKGWSNTLTGKGVINGTDKASESSLARYDSVRKNMLDFLIKIKDYESAMVLYHPTERVNPLPVSEDSAIAYMRYRVYEKGTPVLYPDNTPVVLPDSGQQLLSTGDWRSAGTVGIYRSALSKYHELHETCQGEYHPACQLCSAIPLEKITKEGQRCPLHTGRAHHQRSGNVINGTKFRNIRSNLERYCEDTYEGRSTITLLPGQLRDIRQYLLSRDSVQHLMLWCIITLGVKLFLRVQEVLTIKIESFCRQYCVVRKGEVISLCLQIKGKRDIKPIHFLIIDGKICPELYPLRPLLIYIAATGRTSGYLFPTIPQLFHPSPTEQYEYCNILGDLNWLCTEFLHIELITFEGKIQIVGTHLLRKTAFLLAYWGKRFELKCLDLRSYGTEGIPLTPEDIGSILLDARHHNVVMTATYLSDAATLFALHYRIGEPNTKHKVGPYVPVYIKTPQSVLALHTEGDTRIANNQMTLPQIAHFFVYRVMEVAPTTVLKDNISELCQRSLDLYNKPSNRDVLLTGIKEKVTGPQYQGLCELLESLTIASYNTTFGGTHTQAQASQQQSSTQSVVTPSPVLQAPARPLALQAAPTGPPALATTQDFLQTTQDFQDLYKKAKSPSAMVEIILEACSEIRQGWTGGVVPDPKLKGWVYKAGRIEACIQNCFKGNTKRFLEKNPSFGLNYKCAGKHKFRRNTD